MNIFKKPSLFVQILAIFSIFICSRYYIFTHPPQSYSDVTADYERYANMWRYGLTPYRQHLYEYPPATIPMLSIPLSLDQAGIGKYYKNYRTEILLIDTFFFIYLVWISRRLPWLKQRWFLSLLAYILLTTAASDFLYEGIDLAFTAAAVVALTLSLAITKKSFVLETIVWAFFWLSTAIKFLTLPLLLPLFLLLHRGKLVQQLAACALGFILVWGLPLGLYRSSLQVSFVHNGNRPIKYAAFPAHIIRWVNSFTHSEHQNPVAPDFEYVGPVSTQVTKIDAIVFPLAVLSSIGYMIFILLQKTRTKLPQSFAESKKLLFSTTFVEGTERVRFGLYYYMVYIFTLFLTAKIFSQPFHIWYIPVVVLLPYRSIHRWLLVIALCFLMILLDMTTVLHIKHNFLLFGTIEIALIRDVFRFIPMGIILYIASNELWNIPEPSRLELIASALKKKVLRR